LSASAVRVKYHKQNYETSTKLEGTHRVRTYAILLYPNPNPNL